MKLEPHYSLKLY